MDGRAPFAGGDQRYLRDVQYADGAKLESRASLHERYSTSQVTLAQFGASLVAWPEDAVVLECGCGTGRFWEAAAPPRAAALALTDLSQGMVAEALDRAMASGFGDPAGSACDVQALPFADSSFDVVVANHMLYHVPDPDRAVVELARVLRPAGTLVAATNGPGHMREIDDALAEVFGDHGGGLYDVFGIDTGEARLRERFASVVWHAFDNDLVVDDPAAVLAYARSFPPGESATGAEHDALARAIERRFSGGLLRIRTRAGVFVCRRPRTGP